MTYEMMLALTGLLLMVYGATLAMILVESFWDKGKGRQWCGIMTGLTAMASIIFAFLVVYSPTVSVALPIMSGFSTLCFGILTVFYKKMSGADTQKTPPTDSAR